MARKSLKSSKLQTKGRTIFALQRSTSWSMVIALGMTTLLSYGTTQYLFGVLEVPLATDFAWSRGCFPGRMRWVCSSQAYSAFRLAIWSIATVGAS